MISPAIGTFIKPVSRFGGYLYCLEIMKVVFYEGWAGDLIEQWQYKRWGMKEGEPFNDGHLSTGGSISGMRLVAPGVWKDAYSSRTTGDPIYYRKMSPKGQQDLFI